MFGPNSRALGVRDIGCFGQKVSNVQGDMAFSGDHVKIQVIDGSCFRSVCFVTDGISVVYDMFG